MSMDRALFFAVGAFAGVYWMALRLVFGSLYRLPPLPPPSAQPVFSFGDDSPQGIDLEL